MYRMVEKSLKLRPEERSAECIAATANVLTSIHALRGLSRESMLNMAKHCSCKCYLPGTKIVQQGSDDHKM
jgi:hypothetical protein